MRYMNMNKKDSTKPSMEEILAIKDQKKRNKAYNQYVENMTPKSNCFANCAKAFLVGGLICTLGEGLNSFYEYLGNEKELAALYGTITLIAISIILTGLNIYQKLHSLAVQEVSCRSRVLRILLCPRQLSFRQKVKFLALAVRFLRLQDRLFYMAL